MVTPKGNEEPCELDLVTFSISKGIRLTDLETSGGGRHRVMNLANCGTNWPSYHIGCAKNAPYCVISIYSDTLRSPGDRTTPFAQDAHRSQIMVMRGNGLELRFLAMTRTVLSPTTRIGHRPARRSLMTARGSSSIPTMVSTMANASISWPPVSVRP
jgi:hypothetical protein